MVVLQRRVYDGDEYILFGCDECGEAINPYHLRIHKTITYHITQMSKNGVDISNGKTKKKVEEGETIDLIWSHPTDWLVGFFGKISHIDCGKQANKKLPTLAAFK